VLLDQVTGELGEPITLAVAMKYRPKDLAEIGIAMRGWGRGVQTPSLI
jgi:hypothetical protein